MSGYRLERIVHWHDATSEHTLSFDQPLKSDLPLNDLLDDLGEHMPRATTTIFKALCHRYGAHTDAEEVNV